MANEISATQSLETRQQPGFLTRTFDNFIKAVDVGIIITVIVDIIVVVSRGVNWNKGEFNVMKFASFSQIVLSKFLRLEAEEEIIGDCKNSEEPKTLIQQKFLCVQENSGTATVVKTFTGLTSGYITGYQLLPSLKGYTSHEMGLIYGFNNAGYEFADGLQKEGFGNNFPIAVNIAINQTLANSGSVLETLDSIFKGKGPSGFIEGAIIDKFFEPFYIVIHDITSTITLPFRWILKTVDGKITHNYFAEDVVGKEISGDNSKTVHKEDL